MGHKNSNVSNLEEYPQLNKENLYEYYIVQNHSRLECTLYFGCLLSKLKRALSKFNIVKYPLKYNSISDEDVYEYYIVQNHTIIESVKHFNCNQQIIMDKMHKRNIRKMVPKNSVIQIDKDELYNYYIIQNHTLEETYKYFNISSGSLSWLLRQNNINKDPNLKQENIKKTCIKKYGVENIAKSPIFALNRGGKYYYQGLSFDSKWEIKFYIYAKDHGESIQRCPCSYEYIYNNKIYTYIPDFLYNGQIVELKGPQFFKDDKMICPFDNKKNDLYQAKYQCMKNNKVVILTINNLKHIFDYVDKIYGKKYCDQFKNLKIN